MLIKSKNLLTALVVAGISAVAFPANATTYVAGDILLGFRATDGTGATSNLIVNLGQADTVFRNATSNIASVVDINSLLDATYGMGWENRADLSWGAVAARTASGLASVSDGDPNRTNYATRAQTMLNPGVQTSTSVNITASSTARSDTATAIIGLGTAFNAISGAVVNNGVLTSTTSPSWSTSITDSNFKIGSSIEASNPGGIDATGLDLYRILDNNVGANPTGTVGIGSWEGTFTISSEGVVGFAVTSVPEPSRALLGGLGLAGVFFRRRRSQKA